MSWALYEVEVEFTVPVIARSQAEAEKWAEDPSNAREAFDPYSGFYVSSHKQADIHRGMPARVRRELDNAYIAGDEDLAEILNDVDGPETEEECRLREARENAYGPMLDGIAEVGKP